MLRSPDFTGAIAPIRHIRTAAGIYNIIIKYENTIDFFRPLVIKSKKIGDCIFGLI